MQNAWGFVYGLMPNGWGESEVVLELSWSSGDLKGKCGHLWTIGTVAVVAVRAWLILWFSWAPQHHGLHVVGMGKDMAAQAV